jgi:hypothetical protein
MKSNDIAEMQIMILSAFPEVPYPGDTWLYMGHSNDLGRLEVADFYRGKTWKEVRFDLINDHNGDVWDLGPEPFCYYLPALMSNALSAISSVDDDESRTFVNYLVGYLEPKIKYPELFASMTGCLHREQCLVVYKWMMLIEQIYSSAMIPKSLLDYWFGQAHPDPE